MWMRLLDPWMSRRPRCGRPEEPAWKIQDDDLDSEDFFDDDEEDPDEFEDEQFDEFDEEFEEDDDPFDLDEDEEEL